jgi:hypothetical protein
MSKLQEKPSALKREHPALQTQPEPPPPPLPLTHWIHLFIHRGEGEYQTGENAAEFILE